MKVIFLGTPAFSVPVLDAILKSKHEVVAVVTQNDKPNARGNKIEFSPVKVFALKNNIPVLQYKKIRLDGVEDLKNLNADIMITCAYGQLLSEEVLNICPKGVINVHGSLLPKYRGASPITQAILDGEKETGITMMHTAVGMDDGDIMFYEKLDIGENENYGSLSERISSLASLCAVRALDDIENGRDVRIKQNNDLATFCKKVKKEQTQLAFTLKAEHIKNTVRAFSPTPACYFYYDNKLIKVFEVEVSEGEGKCGEILCSTAKQGLKIMAADKAVSILKLQNAGGKVLAIKDYLNGNKLETGKIIEFKSEI